MMKNPLTGEEDVKWDTNPQKEGPVSKEDLLKSTDLPPHISKMEGYKELKDFCKVFPEQDPESKNTLEKFLNGSFDKDDLVGLESVIAITARSRMLPLSIIGYPESEINSDFGYPASRDVLKTIEWILEHSRKSLEALNDIRDSLKKGNDLNIEKYESYLVEKKKLDIYEDELPNIIAGDH